MLKGRYIIMHYNWKVVIFYINALGNNKGKPKKALLERQTTNDLLFIIINLQKKDK